MPIVDPAEYVIRELTKHRHPRDIIVELCEQSGMRWAEAQSYVERIQTERGDEISRRQKPLLRIVGIATGLIGLGMLLATLGATARGLVISVYYIPYLGNILVAGTGLLMAAGGFAGAFVLDRRVS